MIQLCFDFQNSSLNNRCLSAQKNDKTELKKPPLKMGTPTEIILKFYGQSFLTGWLKVKNSVRFL